MFVNQRVKLAVYPQSFWPNAIFAAHIPSRTTRNPCQNKGSASPDTKGSKGDKSVEKLPIKRAINSGKVRIAFIPEEWFTFFHSKTGVTGPYLLGVVAANYALSKELFVLEHEYYSGLSWLLVLYIVVKKLGPNIASGLDANVDSVLKEFEDSRKVETDHYEALIKDAKDAQWRAEGQKLLIDAKKENIAMQLEAEYRERFMLVQNTVKRRMEYHMKRYQSESRIQQRWMIQWILENVRKAITPDFEKRALDSAIQDLVAIAGRIKK